jgi:Haem-degrading
MRRSLAVGGTIVAYIDDMDEALGHGAEPRRRIISRMSILGGVSNRECLYSEASQIGKDSCSARAFDLVTQVLASSAQSGGPFFGIQASNYGQVMISPRGIPLKRNGHVVEALEVSGGMGEQDQAVAEAGGKQRRGLRLAMTWSRRNGRGVGLGRQEE